MEVLIAIINNKRWHYCTWEEFVYCRVFCCVHNSRGLADHH